MPPRFAAGFREAGRERSRLGRESRGTEFVVVSAKDIPGKNIVALITDDQPCLADGVVNHPEEPILLLAHPDRHRLPMAVEAVSIEYDPLPAIFTMEESESQSQVIWGADNIFKAYLVEKGDIDGIFPHRRR